MRMRKLVRIPLLFPGRKFRADRFAVAAEHALDHGVLGEQLADPLAKLLGAGAGFGRIVERRRNDLREAGRFSGGTMFPSGPRISGMPPTPLAIMGIPAPPASITAYGSGIRPRRHDHLLAVRKGLPRRRVAEEADARLRGPSRATCSRSAGPSSPSPAIANVTLRPALCNSADRLDQHVGALDVAELADAQADRPRRRAAATGSISAGVMPFGTTRTIAGGAPTMAW